MKKQIIKNIVITELELAFELLKNLQANNKQEMEKNMSTILKSVRFKWEE